MDRNDLVLAAMAAGGENAAFPPAQAQKLFFLIDQEIAEHVGGKKFNFEPYDYGPFDSQVYRCLEGLGENGLVLISKGPPHRRYNLTKRGYEAGQRVFGTLPPEVQEFLKDSAKWVNSLQFEQLVSAIYQRYPAMKARSIFRV